jgi:tetratricopeptide (TPR) repeat protein
MQSSLATTSTEPAVTALQRATQRAAQRHENPILVLADGSGPASRAALAAFRRWVAGSTVILVEGTCPSRPVAYGPLPELLNGVSAAMAALDRDVLRRHAGTLTNLVPGWTAPGVKAGGRIRSGLADYCFRSAAVGLQDFYQGRDLRSRMTDDCVQFLLDAADAAGRHDRTLVLHVAELQNAGPAALRTLGLLAHNARGRRLALVATYRGPEADAAALFPAARHATEVVPIHSGPGACEALAHVVRALPRGDLDVLETIAVFDRAVDVDTLAGLNRLGRAAIDPALDRLVDAGVLDRRIDRQVAVPVDVRQLLPPSSAEEARRRSQDALAAADGRSLYDAAHYALALGTVDQRTQDAIEHAWAVSAYDVATQYAERYVAGGAPGLRVDPRLFLALLYSEAGRGAEADAQFKAALAATADPARRAFLLRLMGYNAVFGTRRFEDGIGHFREAAAYFEQHGHMRDVAWIQNSTAFALTQLGRVEEAMALERNALEKAERLARPDRFLFTILHLNLGRLHRPRSVEAAVSFIERSMSDSAGELNLHLLLLFYATLASLYRSKGMPREELTALRQCVSVFADAGVAASRRVFPLLCRQYVEHVGTFDDERMMRSDQLQLSVAFNLALTYEELGHPDRGAIYRGWAAQRLAALGEPQHAERVKTAGPASRCRAAVGRTEQPTHVSTLERYADLVSFRRDADAGRAVAAALADERLVAWLPADGGERIEPIDALVLFDPRSAQARARVLRDLGRHGTTGSALALPEAAAWFRDLDPRWPLVLQHATVVDARRPALAGITPVRTRVQVLDERCGGSLHGAVASFYRRTAVPLVGVMGLRLAGERIAASAESALKYFLETTIELLVWGNLVIEKRHGRAAAENLAVLRPRLSGLLASASRDGAAGAAGLIVTRERLVGVGAQARALLEQCDGERTIGELAGLQPHAGQVYAFFRRLREQNVLHFGL